MKMPFICAGSPGNTLRLGVMLMLMVLICKIVWRHVTSVYSELKFVIFQLAKQMEA